MYFTDDHKPGAYVFEKKKRGDTFRLAVDHIHALELFMSKCTCKKDSTNWTMRFTFNFEITEIMFLLAFELYNNYRHANVLLTNQLQKQYVLGIMHYKVFTLA